MYFIVQNTQTITGMYKKVHTYIQCDTPMYMYVNDGCFVCALLVWTEVARPVCCTSCMDKVAPIVFHTSYDVPYIPTYSVSQGDFRIGVYHTQAEGVCRGQ